MALQALLLSDVGFYPCHRCGLDACPQCDDCRLLGTSSACSVLYEASLESGPSATEAPGVRVESPFTLSPFQKESHKSSSRVTRTR